jgi:hypothetical protein
VMNGNSIILRAHPNLARNFKPVSVHLSLNYKLTKLLCRKWKVIMLLCRNLNLIVLLCRNLKPVSARLSLMQSFPAQPCQPP